MLVYIYGVPIHHIKIWHIHISFQSVELMKPKVTYNVLGTIISMRTQLYGGKVLGVYKL